MASLVSLTNSRAPGLRCGFCLVPGSGVIASWGVQASGGGRAPLYLVSLQIKSTPLAESFNISKNWLALGGVVSSSQEGFLSKHGHIQKIKNMIDTRVGCLALQFLQSFEAPHNFSSPS